jgi:hypothetical protein
MPNERRIEKLLRAFAKKRKADAGAPLEMHPATRRLLQDEVARGAKKSRRKDVSLWQMLFGTPRRAFAVCALMSLIISGSVFVTTMKKSGSTADLAKNQMTRQRELLRPAPAVQPMVLGDIPASTPTPPTEAERKDLKEDEDRSAALNWASNVNGTMVASAGSSPKSSVSGLAQDKVENAVLPPTSVTDAAQFKAPVTSSGSVAANRSETSDFAGASALDGHGELAEDSKILLTSTNGVQNFYADVWSAGFQNTNKSNGQLAMQKFYRARQVDALKDDEKKTGNLGLQGKKRSAGQVLDSFSIQQDGNKITVVDSDGSQYIGTMDTRTLGMVAPTGTATFGSAGGGGGGFGGTVASRRAPVTVAAGAVNVEAITATPGQNYFFTVVGTNVSLNRLVVFSGNLVPMTNLIRLNDEMMTNAVISDVNGQQPLLQNFRVEGRAIVGKKTGVKIEATPGP